MCVRVAGAFCETPSAGLSQPSRHEAMAAWCPVIATSAPGRQGSIWEEVVLELCSSCAPTAPETPVD